MPKNVRGGKSSRKGRNQRDDGGQRDLVLRQDEQEYGQIKNALGDKRFSVFGFDGKDRIAHVPGKFRKRVFFVAGDIVLLQRRNFDSDAKCDLLHKYSSDEVTRLKKLGEIPVKAGMVDIDLLDEEAGDIVEFTNADLDAL